MHETGKTYRGKQLSLDGKCFENCTFERCELDYGGGIPPVLSGCSFDNCSFSFSGKAAYTLAFLSGMHGGGFSTVVEQTFQGIRDGAYLRLPVQEIEPPGAPRQPVDAHPLAFRVPRIVSVPRRKS